MYPELPKESVAYYDLAVAGLQQGDYEGAQTATQIFHNYLKVTANYQAGLQDLKGPGGMLIGLPIITFSQPESEAIAEGASILNAIQFIDVSATSGLELINTKGSNPHTALGDYDGDGDQDLYFGNADAHYLLRNDLGKFTDLTRDVGISHSRPYGFQHAF